MKIRELIYKYNINSQKIQDLEISKSNIFKSTIIGYGISLAVIISPIIVLYNLFLYPQHQKLLIGLISLCAFIFFSLGDYLYQRTIRKIDTRVQEISYKENLLLNSIVYFIICLIIFIIAILII